MVDPQPPAPFSRLSVLGYVWGAMLCPLYWSLVDHLWDSACLAGCIVTGTFAMWLMELRKRQREARNDVR